MDELSLRFSRFFIRHRRVNIILIGAATAYFGWEALQLQVFSQFIDLLPRNHPYIQVYENYNRQFGSANIVTAAIVAQEGSIYDESVLKDNEDSVAGIETGERDEMYERAVRTVIQEGKCSITLIQRRLQLGYARAARIVDMMEQEGVVGPGEGSKPRDILAGSELIAESERVQQECAELVRQYESAVTGGRGDPPARSNVVPLLRARPRPAAPQDKGARRKALLLMLIEELL